MEKNNMPLLLLDNSHMMNVLNMGEFKVTNLTFEEARAVINMFDTEKLLVCFANRDITDIIFKYLGIDKKEYTYKQIHNMKVGQDAIVFKLYTTPSETQPIIVAEDGIEAKKIQNIYIYCQFISRIS